MFQNDDDQQMEDEEGEEGGMDMDDFQDMIDFAVYQELFSDNAAPAKSRKEFVTSSYTKIIFKLF